MTRLDELAHLPRNEEGPVFREPWEAQAFAMAVKLSEEGHFTWKEWADAVAATPHGQPVELQARGGKP